MVAKVQDNQTNLYHDSLSNFSYFHLVEVVNFNESNIELLKKVLKHFLFNSFFFLLYTLIMTIELNEAETNLVLEGLGELPAKKSIQLILKLKMAWDEQRKEAPSDNLS